MKRMNIPRIIAIVMAIFVVVSFFLPYISATDEYRVFLRRESNAVPFSSIDLTASDLMDVSLFTFARVYFYAGEEIFKSKSESTFYVILTSSVACFAVLIMLSALGKKPILVLLFDALMAGASYLIHLDFLSRDIMLIGDYDWGISHSLYYPIAIVIFICAVCMFIVKRRAKKAAKTAKAR